MKLKLCENEFGQMKVRERCFSMLYFNFASFRRKKPSHDSVLKVKEKSFSLSIMVYI